jgi:hypothetical protein
MNLAIGSPASSAAGGCSPLLATRAMTLWHSLLGSKKRKYCRAGAKLLIFLLIFCLSPRGDPAYTCPSMRRFAAIFVLLVIACYVGAPLLEASSSADARLPACCRSGGKHHCNMAMPAESGAHFSSLSTKCPLHPRPAMVPLTRIVAAPGASSLIDSQTASYPAIVPQTRALHRISLDRSRQKRGPPAAL